MCNCHKKALSIGTKERDKKITVKKRIYGFIVISLLLGAFYIINTKQFDLLSVIVGGIVISIGLIIIRAQKFEMISFKNLSINNVFFTIAMFFTGWLIDNILFS
ncbi:hypothetical protein ETI06_09605 [Macrococcoides goetzii]|nr:hypothetical protein [Macrococcus goetzii]TDM40311.1 hypothetical protein ETI10_06625 [Macrococcus goetzii]TDM45673.1 hypothetical protein ETI08_09945 [Macrococcus goetzii]TDM48720.1 hypothetical protein ETI06_09605 [Macrococcus goetzii]